MPVKDILNSQLVKVPHEPKLFKDVVKYDFLGFSLLMCLRVVKLLNVDQEQCGTLRKGSSKWMTALPDQSEKQRVNHQD